MATSRWAYLLLWLAFALPGGVLAEETPLSRIAFGSCAKQDLPQPIWDAVVDTDPQIFLFIGDNIYGDSADMDVLRAKWAQLGAQPGYQKLKAHCPIYAVWDDHDFGLNDGGVEFAAKDASQQVFLDFFEEPASSPRRTRKGLYDARIVGPEGQRVQLILLDTRYFRTRLIRHNEPREPGEGDRGPYAPNLDPQATVLGEEQWAWLAEQLRQPADLRIIATSIQLLADGHRWEGWGTFPLERQRMLGLLKQTKASGVIFISGDRHSAEISAIDIGLGYPVLDVTSSSLNRPAKWHTEFNPYRQGTKYLDENFGTILIDWSQEDPVIRSQVRDIDGKVVLQHRTTLGQMQAK
ncbi:MAG: alkaline phosphatase family protein [Planctomycetaceae bacterium]|nr:alkaline phosphatase family protein [Planctomycetaceae bacterium]